MTSANFDMASSSTSNSPFGSPASPISLESFLELLSGKLEEGSGSIELSRTEASDIVQCLRSRCNDSANRGLETREEEDKVLRFHARYGDYAGYVFNSLKNASLGNLLGRRADLINDELQREAQFPEGSPRPKPYTSAVEAATAATHMEDLAKLDEDTAKFAVEAYSARNAACHSKFMLRRTADDWHGLGQQIVQDLEELPKLLPMACIGDLDKWRRLIKFFRDRHVDQGEDDCWIKRPGFEDLGAADRTQHPIEVTCKDLHDMPAGNARAVLFDQGLFRDSSWESSIGWECRKPCRTIPTHERYFRRKADAPSNSPRPDNTSPLDADGKATGEEEEQRRKDYQERFVSLVLDLAKLRELSTGKALSCVDTCVGNVGRILADAQRAVRKRERGKDKKAWKAEARSSSPRSDVSEDYHLDGIFGDEECTWEADDDSHLHVVSAGNL